MKPRMCELCGGDANLYCSSDAAFLCWSCDAKVHEANFLVARHVRRTLCCHCRGFDGIRLSGVGFRQIRPLCRRCFSPENTEENAESCISSTSDCVSSTDSATSAAEKAGSGSRSSRLDRAVVDEKAEGILVIWSRRMGLRNGRSVYFALHAFGICRREFRVLPFRVCLASSLWLAATVCEPRGMLAWQMKRLEECSRAPSKTIRLAASKLWQTMRVRKSASPRTEEDKEVKEGCAECSDG